MSQRRDPQNSHKNCQSRVLANHAITIVAELDHAAAAASVGLDLPPNRVVVFGNPNLGTPLMQANQTTGIDLPQKIQVFEEEGAVFVAYNSVDYLTARHDISGAATLPTIEGALRMLAEAATGTEVDDNITTLRSIPARNGLVTIDSSFGSMETQKRLASAIDGSPAAIAFVLDHSANAACVGLELAPTTVTAFDNPAVGTLLMQVEPTVGIDLPLKALVWEDGDGVHVTYNDPRFLLKRYFAQSEQSTATMIAALLDSLVAEATG